MSKLVGHCQLWGGPPYVNLEHVLNVGKGILGISEHSSFYQWHPLIPGEPLDE